MDPQHRVFLESCYEALENAGYTSEKYPGEIGVFAGCGMNNYLVKNLFQHPGSLRSLGEFQTIINNNSDYLTTRVSYKLNLTGPSIDIQSACSTSLVAIHIACQNLVNHNCDIALAGGVFIQIPHAEGYMYEPGGIFLPTDIADHLTVSQMAPCLERDPEWLFLKEWMMLSGIVIQYQA